MLAWHESTYGLFSVCAVIRTEKRIVRSLPAKWAKADARDGVHQVAELMRQWEPMPESLDGLARLRRARCGRQAYSIRSGLGAPW